MLDIDVAEATALSSRRLGNRQRPRMQRAAELADVWLDAISCGYELCTLTDLLEAQSRGIARPGRLIVVWIAGADPPRHRHQHSAC
jgi:hypothetical protein